MQLQRRRDTLATELAQRAGDRAAALRGWEQVVQANQAELGSAAVPTAMARVSLAEALLAVDQRDAARATATGASGAVAQLAPQAELLRRLDA